MELISSYGIEIKRLGKKMLLPTITIYNQAVSFCVEVFEKEWANIDHIKDMMKQKSYAEKLIHSTKTHNIIEIFNDNFKKTEREFSVTCIRDESGTDYPSCFL